MKQIYKKPQLFTVMLSQKKPMMMTTSVKIGANYNGSAIIEVKEESHSVRNIWDDDWSK